MSEDNKASWLNVEELVHAIMRGWTDSITRKTERVPASCARQLAENIVNDSKVKAALASKETKRLCKNCRHSEFFEVREAGSCRRDPPRETGSGWPIVRRHDWCSRHEAAGTVPFEIIHEGQKPQILEFPKGP